MTENRRRPHDATQTVVLGPVASRPTAVLSAGTRLGERYRIEGVLGSGGFAVVYLADDLRDGRQVALKVLRPDRVSATALRRFRREAEVANRTDSPHLVPVLDVGVAGGSPYLAMERVDGESLSQLLDRGALPVPRALDLACQILRGLAALHEAGVLHRDVKPQNILLAADGTVRLADFGLALSEQHAAETRATATEAVVGTVEYLSPEQALGEEVDARSDLYSFGVVLFEMLTGRLPHRAKSSLGTLVAHIQQPAPDVRQLAADVPIWLAAVVARLLAKRPQERYPSARAVLADLEGRRATRPTGWARWRLRPSPHRAAGARWGRYVAAVLLALLVAAGVGFGLQLSRRQLSHVSQEGADLIGVARSGAVLWRLQGQRGSFELARLRPGEPARLVGVAGPSAAMSETPRQLQIRRPSDGEILETVSLPSQRNTFPGMADRFKCRVRVEDLDGDGYAEVLLYHYHQPYWPSYTLLYEPRIGRLRPVLIASGHHPYAGSVDLDGDGRRELLFAGVANRLGWHSAVAAVRPDPPVNAPSSGIHAAETPDRFPRLLRSRSLVWYALLSRRVTSPADYLTVDQAARQIVLRPPSGGEYVLDFWGFPADAASDLEGEERNGLRIESYRHLHEAQRLAALGFGDEAVAQIAEARQLAQRVDAAHLAEWCARVEIGILVRLGRYDDAEALAGRLLSSQVEKAEVAFDVARPMFLAGEAERALPWFMSGLGKDGDESVGRAKYEFLDGLVFSLDELGRPEEARQELQRYQRAYQVDVGGVGFEVDLLNAYLDWRHGGPDAIVTAHLDLENSTTDFARYLDCELRHASGEPVAALLDRVDLELDRSSETLPMLRSLRAVLLARQGRDDEAAATVRSAWEDTLRQRPDDMYGRALTGVVAQRYADLTGEPLPSP